MMMDGDTVVRNGDNDVRLFWDYCGFGSGNYAIC